MAGGTASKSTALAQVALARMKDAAQAIRELAQNGMPPSDPRHAGKADPAVTAAIAALQALQ
jgi:hypothetical protein